MKTEVRLHANGFSCLLVGIPAQDRFADTAPLAYGIELAAAFGAGLSVYVLPSSRFPGAAASTIWVQETDRLRRQAETALTGASAAKARSGVRSLSEQANSPSEARDRRFVQLASVHDIAILKSADASETLARSAIEDALFDSGRPVLLVPARGAWSKPPRRIAIAWDGSARAARAVKDALPLLSSAELVVAMTVTDEKDLSGMPTGAELAIYLAHHGIECKILTMAGERLDVGARMRLFAAEDDIDLIVVGAFVHSRFRQALLGGVTRSLLDDCQVPLFLAH